jgi:hypothetical protein
MDRIDRLIEEIKKAMEAPTQQEADTMLRTLLERFRAELLAPPVISEDD